MHTAIGKTEAHMVMADVSDLVDDSNFLPYSVYGHLFTAERCGGVCETVSSAS